MNQDVATNNTGHIESNSTLFSYAAPTTSVNNENNHVASNKKALKVLFLSADTGGGHRASAESLANQFRKHYPGTEYDLLDIWTPTNVFPYKTLVDSYKHLSAHPRRWKTLYYISNTRIYEKFTNIHSTKLCYDKIYDQMEQYDPDVVISVHPTMNYLPERITREIAKKRGKYVPFFTVVTDFGSGHCTWFQGKPNKVFIASDRIKALASKRGVGLNDENLVMAGLPIRGDFAVHAKKMGSRTTVEGEEYRHQIQRELGLSPEKKTVLIMGGGEGVGSLGEITEKIYLELKKKGVDATICVVCGRNEKLKKEFEEKDWDDLYAKHDEKKRTSKRRKLKHFITGREKYANDGVEKESNVDVIGLGFVTNMADYMVASDILVSKAGPGTIAEAAAVGLPVMITSFLPGQEAGNVDIVLDGGFGAFEKKPKRIASTLSSWLQNDSLVEEMSNRAAEVGNPNAASDIVKEIAEETLEFMNKQELSP